MSPLLTAKWSAGIFRSRNMSPVNFFVLISMKRARLLQAEAPVAAETQEAVPDKQKLVLSAIFPFSPEDKTATTARPMSISQTFLTLASIVTAGPIVTAERAFVGDDEIPSRVPST
jgi:hypothetical protein